MNKRELLRQLSEKIRSGEITREEAMSYIDDDASLKTEKEKKGSFSFSDFSVTKLLYILGAAIVIVGIIVFVSQIWNDIGSFGRILVTLGMGFLMAGIGSFLLKQKQEEVLGSVFHVMGGVLIPFGVVVTLSEFFRQDPNLWIVAFAFVVVFVFYLLLNHVHKNPVLTFFAIANATASVYAIFGAITQDLISSFVDNLYAYLTILIGASYILLAKAFKETWNDRLVGILYFVGSVGVLASAFSQVFDSLAWQLFYFLIVVGGLFLAINVKSRIILSLSTIFLIAHITFITNEYFADSIGWPLALVILGFIFIGLGYFSVNLSRKYIEEE